MRRENARRHRMNPTQKAITSRCLGGRPLSPNAPRVRIDGDRIMPSTGVSTVKPVGSLNQPRTLPAFCRNNIVRERFNLRQFIDGRLRHSATVL